MESELGSLVSPEEPPIYFLRGDRFTVALTNLSKLCIRFKPFENFFLFPLTRLRRLLLLSATS